VKATYDNEADALMIEFFDPPAPGYAEDVDGSACFVGVDDDNRRVSVELLHASERLILLDVAAEKYKLDVKSLRAAAAAAMAAPLRFVTVEVGGKMPD
jgi:uncharacterized protein YuzE